MQFFIPNAWAAGPASATPGGGDWTFFLIIAGFFVLMYFLMIRPQQKRQKQHRQMIEQISVGDEVVTSGGMLGKVRSLGEQFIGLEIGKDVVIQVQKSSIGAVLPKGTVKHN